MKQFILRGGRVDRFHQLRGRNSECGGGKMACWFRRRTAPVGETEIAGCIVTSGLIDLHMHLWPMTHSAL